MRHRFAIGLAALLAVAGYVSAPPAIHSAIFIRRLARIPGIVVYL